MFILRTSKGNTPLILNSLPPVVFRSAKKFLRVINKSAIMEQLAHFVTKSFEYNNNNSVMDVLNMALKSDDDELIDRTLMSSGDENGSACPNENSVRHRRRHHHADISDNDDESEEDNEFVDDDEDESVDIDITDLSNSADDDKDSDPKSAVIVNNNNNNNHNILSHNPNTSVKDNKSVLSTESNTMIPDDVDKDIPLSLIKRINKDGSKFVTKNWLISEIPKSNNNHPKPPSKYARGCGGDSTLNENLF